MVDLAGSSGRVRVSVSGSVPGCSLSLSVSLGPSCSEAIAAEVSSTISCNVYRVYKDRSDRLDLLRVDTFRVC